MVFQVLVVAAYQNLRLFTFLTPIALLQAQVQTWTEDFHDAIGTPADFTKLKTLMSHDLATSFIIRFPVPLQQVDRKLRITNKSPLVPL